jgi:hypothetical protein
VESTFLSGRDALLFALPSCFLLAFTVFRVGIGFATPKVPLSRRRPKCGMDRFGEPILRDPDGKLSCMGRRNRVPRRAQTS